MANDWGIGESIANLFKILLLLFPLSILGIWKLIELICWIISHIKIV